MDGDDSLKPWLPVEPSQGPGLSASEKVATAASTVAWLEVLLEGLRDGTRTWAEWDESLEDWPDRTEVAINRCETALTRAHEDLRALTRSAETDMASGSELHLSREVRLADQI